MNAKRHFSKCSLPDELNEFVEVQRCCRKLVRLVNVRLNVLNQVLLLMERRLVQVDQSLDFIGLLHLRPVVCQGLFLGRGLNVLFGVFFVGVVVRWLALFIDRRVLTGLRLFNLLKFVVCRLAVSFKGAGNLVGFACVGCILEGRLWLRLVLTVASTLALRQRWKILAVRDDLAILSSFLSLPDSLLLPLLFPCFFDGFNLQLVLYVIFRACALVLLRLCVFSRSLVCRRCYCGEELLWIYTSCLSAWRLSLDVGDSLPMGLDILYVVVDLDVEGRFVNFDLIFVVCLVLQTLKQRGLVQHYLTC